MWRPARSPMSCAACSEIAASSVAVSDWPISSLAGRSLRHPRFALIRARSRTTRAIMATVPGRTTCSSGTTTSSAAPSRTRVAATLPSTVFFYDIDTGRVIDHVNGLVDLEARLVRTIGDPDIRFREDPVRILRAVKFAARCDLTIEPETYRRMMEHKGEVAKCAQSRVSEEFFRLLRAGAARRSFELLLGTGLLEVLSPDLARALRQEPADEQARVRIGSLLGLSRRHRPLDYQPRGHASDALLLATLLLATLARCFAPGQRCFSNRGSWSCSRRNPLSSNSRYRVAIRSWRARSCSLRATCSRRATPTASARVWRPANSTRTGTTGGSSCGRGKQRSGAGGPAVGDARLAAPRPWQMKRCPPTLQPSVERPGRRHGRRDRALPSPAHRARVVEAPATAPSRVAPGPALAPTSAIRYSRPSRAWPTWFVPRLSAPHFWVWDRLEAAGVPAGTSQCS